MTPQRRRQLMAFLRRLGVDPTAAGGPGDSAAALAPIEEALSHSSAGQARNHEKLEFLGDAVLRLAATEVLQRAHPSLSVGQCSSLRAQLVSDRWLAELAERCDLPTVVHLGPMAMSDRAGRATVLAETCEALVGGMYSAWGAGSGGLAAVEAWLAPHWQRAAAELLADPHRHNWKSALQEWSQGQGRGLPGYTCHECSRIHGDPRRFHCVVALAVDTACGNGQSDQGLPEQMAEPLGEGWGGSRRDAEQQAARQALLSLGMLSPAPAS